MNIHSLEFSPLTLFYLGYFFGILPRSAKLALPMKSILKLFFDWFYDCYVIGMSQTIIFDQKTSNFWKIEKFAIEIKKNVTWLGKFGPLGRIVIFFFKIENDDST